MSTPSPVVLSIESYRAFAKRLAEHGDFEMGGIDCRTFPDGERYQRIECDVRDREVIVVGGTVDDHATLELYDLACGAVACGASRLSLVVPYYGCSTMERAVLPGEVVTAKTRARLLSAIPMAGLGNHIYLLDLHADGIAQYFEGPVHAVHVYAKPLIMGAARELGGDDFVLASTDAGRAKWVESLANDMDVDVVIAYKRRVSWEDTEMIGFSGNVEGRHVIIYDDMIRTGSSLRRAAQAYREAGADTVDAICTHGIFPGDSLERLLEGGVINRICCTDSHSRVRELPQGMLDVLPVAPLFTPYLRSPR